MADSEQRNFQQYCMHFYNGRTCPSGEFCLFPHKSRYEVEQVGYLRGDDFFLGKPRPRKLCHFYHRGCCKKQENCQFLHDNDNNLRNINNINHSSRNMPSTSKQTESAHKNYAKGADNSITEQIYNVISQEERNQNNNEEVKDNNNSEKEQEVAGTSASPPLWNESWVNAPEFFPKNFVHKPRSYAEALSPEALAEKNSNRKLCPYINKDGLCRNLSDCTYLHGDMCDMCERLVLHPYNEELRKKHRQECIKEHEKNMELSFAIARSKEKSCGVCFEVIMEKATGEQRFGILPNCNHCFCLTCIRKWRQARQFENKIIRACPECRVTSDFVCPSMYWVDTKEDKEKLIDDYKKALSKKDCKYFKKGTGKCPFGNKCFYRHAFPDGSTCDVGPPPRQRRHRGFNNVDIEALQHIMLWDFLDERDVPWQTLADDLEDLVSFFTDSDESDWSDYDLFFD